MTIGAMLWDACSDCYAGYEIWNVARLVVTMPRGDAHPRATVANITEKAQRSLFDEEDAIQRSQWRVASSKRLLEATEEVRQNLRSHGAAGVE